MTVPVCPICRRTPRQDANGFFVCAEHGRLSRLLLVPFCETTESVRREDDLPSGSIIGSCEAVVGSARSHRSGELCGKPARFRDGEGRPVCGYHRPEYIADLQQRVLAARDRSRVENS